jgi:hypothetical protein
MLYLIAIYLFILSVMSYINTFEQIDNADNIIADVDLLIYLTNFYPLNDITFFYL